MIILDYLGGSNVITRGPNKCKGSQKRENQRYGNMKRTQRTLLALTMKEGAMSQGIWAVSKVGKGKEMDCP